MILINVELVVQHPHAGERGYEIAYVPGLEQVCQAVGQQEAERLAACWNAFLGVPTEQISRKLLRKRVRRSQS